MLPVICPSPLGFFVECSLRLPDTVDDSRHHETCHRFDSAKTEKKEGLKEKEIAVEEAPLRQPFVVVSLPLGGVVHYFAMCRVCSSRALECNVITWSKWGIDSWSCGDETVSEETPERQGVRISFWDTGSVSHY
mmetsp:Transcript_27378/g.50459  ORF Transcript_27378/g.50459 Transcript_27378/m.50459 type:complete len:134 (-) Transcript_27378:380-781(-)